MSESPRRIHLATIANLHSLNTRPVDANYSNAFENLWTVNGVPFRFDRLEVDIIFDDPSVAGTIVVIPFLSRLNPAGTGDTVTDSRGDTWGTFGPQTAQAEPLTQEFGDRIWIDTAMVKYVQLCSRSSGSACDAEVYGIYHMGGR